MPGGALRVPEVARRLGVDSAEVYGLNLDGGLPPAKGDGGLVYVTAEALEEFPAPTRADAPVAHAARSGSRFP